MQGLATQNGQLDTSPGNREAGDTDTDTIPFLTSPCGFSYMSKGTQIMDDTDPQADALHTDERKQEQ